MASSSKISSTVRGGKSSGTKSPESFQSLSKRNTAAEILQSYEKLSWYSAQRCESLTQTRLHFQNIVAGFTDADEAALVDWKDDLTPRGEAARGKGKERVSDIGAGGGGGAAASGSASAKKKPKSDGRAAS